MVFCGVFSLIQSGPLLLASFILHEIRLNACVSFFITECKNGTLVASRFCWNLVFSELVIKSQIPCENSIAFKIMNDIFDNRQ
jgi:hypothetical protein